MFMAKSGLGSTEARNIKARGTVRRQR